MSEFLKTAIEKLHDKKGITDRCAVVMMDSTAKALESYCRQDEEFAQAVAQGGSFAECMKAVAKGVSGASGISDLNAYRRAAKFYFPGSGIYMTMTIDVNAGEPIDDIPEARKPSKKSKAEDVDDIEDENDTDEDLQSTARNITVSEVGKEEPAPVKKSLIFSLDDFI